MSDQVSEIEIENEDAKKQVALQKAHERLLKNPDFQLLVVKSYLTDEASRLVHCRSNPAMQTPELQAANLRDIDGVGSFLSFLRNVRITADMAQRALDVAQEELEREQQEANQ